MRPRPADKATIHAALAAFALLSLGSMTLGSMTLGSVAAASTRAGTIAIDGMTLLHETAPATDSVALPVRAADTPPVTRTIAGRVQWRSFRDPTAMPPGAAIEAATASLGAGAHERLLDCATADCGGFAFRLAVDLLPVPWMVMNPTDFHQRSLRGTDAQGRTVYTSLLASRLGGATHLQMVTVLPGAGPPATPDAGAPPPEAAPPEALPEGDPPQTDVARALAQTGRIVVTDLALDSAGGPSQASLDASAILDTVAGMMIADPTLTLLAVGHSDGVGALDVNKRLSRRRARAVVDALVARGVPRARLSAEGAGWLMPVAPNDTEAGRAANRRVELIRR